MLRCKFDLVEETHLIMLYSYYKALTFYLQEQLTLLTNLLTVLSSQINLILFAPSARLTTFPLSACISLLSGM